jgi:hypothetical protein
MPKSDAYFEGKGIGTKYKSQPISVRFSEEVEKILRDKSKVADRQAYIRQAVEEKLRADGLLSLNLDTSD